MHCQVFTACMERIGLNVWYHPPLICPHTAPQFFSLFHWENANVVPPLLFPSFIHISLSREDATSEMQQGWPRAGSISHFLTSFLTRNLLKGQFILGSCSGDIVINTAEQCMLQEACKLMHSGQILPQGRKASIRLREIAKYTLDWTLGKEYAKGRFQ